MKLFFKTKLAGIFYGSDILSLGIVSEDNRQFYAEFNDYAKSQINLSNKFYILDKFIKKNEYVMGYHVGDVYDNTLALETWLNQFKDEDELILISDNDPFGFVHLNFMKEALHRKRHCHPCHQRTWFDHCSCNPYNDETILDKILEGYYDISYDASKFFEIPFYDYLKMDKSEFITKASLYSQRPSDDMIIPAPKGTAIYDAHIVKKTYENINSKKEEKPETPQVEEDGNGISE